LAGHPAQPPGGFVRFADTQALAHSSGIFRCAPQRSRLLTFVNAAVNLRDGQLDIATFRQELP
jgi:hypothetical protein